FVVGYLFALPSPSHIFGASVPMPARLLWEFVPAFRVPSRWDPLLMAALVPLAALGLDRLVRGRSRMFGFAVVGAALVLSFLELAIHPAEARFRTTPAPPEYAAVKHTPDGVLADHPLGNSDIFHLWQRAHGRPIVNDAPPGTPADQGRLMLLDPSAPGTASALSFLGITSIAMHPACTSTARSIPASRAAIRGTSSSAGSPTARPCGGSSRRRRSRSRRSPVGSGR